MVTLQPPPEAVAEICKAFPVNLGVASMLDNGVIIVKSATEANGKRIEFETPYRPGDPGYGRMLANLGDMKPGDLKCVPPFRPSIGVATLLSDGSLVLDLRGKGVPGLVSEATREIYRPTDPGYGALMKQFQGMKVGEYRDVYAQPSKSPL
jgi:hypothetical protein